MCLYHFVFDIFRWRRQNKWVLSTFDAFLFFSKCLNLSKSNYFMLHSSIWQSYLHFSALLTQFHDVFFQHKTTYNICMFVGLLMLRMTPFETLMMRMMWMFPLSFSLFETKSRQFIWLHSFEFDNLIILDSNTNNCSTINTQIIRMLKGSIPSKVSSNFPSQWLTTSYKAIYNPFHCITSPLLLLWW